MMKTTKGVLIASAVASLFVMNAASAQQKTGTDTSKGVKCAGSVWFPRSLNGMTKCRRSKP